MKNAKAKSLIGSFLARTNGISAARIVRNDFSDKNIKALKKAFPHLFFTYYEGEWIVSKEEIIIKKE